MEESARGATNTSDELSGDYESPQVFDLGSVFEVTFGSSTGGADSNGQGLY